jgi:transposase, IS5 family
MLTMYPVQVATLWDTVLPRWVRALPEDLARLDEVLNSPRLMRKFEQHWGRANLHLGRPSIPMATYLRLMVLRHSHGWGHQRLVYQVSDSFHLRLFCGIAIDAAVPDESTIRKLTRRLGPELVNDLIREVIKLTVQKRGFRIRALRCDSTTQQADIRYPTDSGLVVTGGSS